MGNTCPTTAKSQPVSASVNPVTPQRRRAATVTSSPTAQPAAGIGRIPILDVCPTVSHGRWAAKAVVGEMVPIEATVFREGHDAVGATAVLLSPRGKRHTARMVDIAPGLDRFQGFLAPTEPGRWKIKVEAWSDPYGTWEHDAGVKIAAGIDAELMCAEGVLLFQRAARQRGITPEDKAALRSIVAALRDTTLSPQTRFEAATAPQITAIMRYRSPLRDLVTSSQTYPLTVHRPQALFNSWYEFFPAQKAHTAPTTEHGFLAHYRPRANALAPSPTWVSTRSTSPRSTRSAQQTVKGPTTHCTQARTTRVPLRNWVTRRRSRRHPP